MRSANNTFSYIEMERELDYQLIKFIVIQLKIIRTMITSDLQGQMPLLYTGKGNSKQGIIHVPCKGSQKGNITSLKITFACKETYQIN